MTNEKVLAKFMYKPTESIEKIVYHDKIGNFIL